MLTFIPEYGLWLATCYNFADENSRLRVVKLPFHSAQNNISHVHPHLRHIAATLPTQMGCSNRHIIFHIRSPYLTGLRLIYVVDIAKLVTRNVISFHATVSELVRSSNSETVEESEHNVTVTLRPKGA